MLESSRAIDPNVRLARWLLVPLVAATLVAALTLGWSAVWSVDNRTYVEMTSGVRRHGLPYLHNGDLPRWSEARTPFNYASGQRLWGQYPPLYPYLAAPALAVWGRSIFSRLNAVLLGLLALCVFGLARRVVRHPLAATAASYIVTLSTPALVIGFESLSLPLMMIALVLACHAALAAVDATGRRSYLFAAACGLAGGFAVLSHLLAFTMVATLPVALALAGSDTPRERSKRAGIAALALAVTLVPLATLNHVRFDTWNPLSYGKCLSIHCSEDSDHLLVRGFLGWIFPVLSWCVGTAIGLVLVRKSKIGIALVGAAAILALLPHSALHDRAFAIVRNLYGYVIDMSAIDLRTPEFRWFGRHPDGLGNMRTTGDGPLAHGLAIRSLLQCTPFLAIAVLAPRAGVSRARLVILLAPVLGLLCQLALFARFPGAHAFGFPRSYPRYIIPAAPLLAVLAVAAVERWNWRRSHLALVVVVAILGTLMFARSPDDASRLRRLIELRGTLAVVAASVAAGIIATRTGRARELACVLTAIAVGCGLALVPGVEGAFAVRYASRLEARIQRFASLTPRRFAVAGWGPETDTVLAMRADHEIEYIDFTESRNWKNFRRLIDIWTEHHRPVFGVFPVGNAFRWPYADWDCPATPLDAAEGFWRVGPPRRPMPPP